MAAGPGLETRPLKVLHVITDLDVGGAEVMLEVLVRRLAEDRVASEVVTMTRPGVVGAELAASGTVVHSLDMGHGAPDPRGLLRLARIVRSVRPDVVHAWMYHADLLAGLAGRLTRTVPVVWSLHNSDLDPLEQKRLSGWTVRACARLASRLAARTICPSRAAAADHVRIGYPAEHIVLIPNGVDTQDFAPDAAARRAVRAELGTSDEPLVGIIARYAAQKDHQTFAAAAGLVARRHPEARFVLAGEGVTVENRELVQALQRAGAWEASHLLGRRRDVAEVMAALDVVTLSSANGEAFPMVLVEGMACGVPCVATDVGDCAEIIGDTGRVAAPRDPSSLATAIADLLSLPQSERARLGADARRRVEERYELRDVSARHEALYREVLRGDYGADR